MEPWIGIMVPHGFPLLLQQELQKQLVELLLKRMEKSFILSSLLPFSPELLLL
jgi:hypothetical protein